MPLKKPIEWEENENGCWICTSHYKNSHGYPMFTWDARQRQMTRFIYEQCFGELSDDLVVMHKCDNPSCINPEHLESGTQADNIRDMVSKNRQPKWERCYNAKLTNEQAKSIFYDKRFYKVIVQEYGISLELVCRIKTKRAWRGIA
jgi:hypothetical protein